MKRPEDVPHLKSFGFNPQYCKEKNKNKKLDPAQVSTQ